MIVFIAQILSILGFKCSRHQLQVIIKEEEMGGKEKDAYNFANLLLVVDRLQGNDYDLYDEIRQVWSIGGGRYNYCYSYYSMVQQAS